MLQVWLEKISFFSTFFCQGSLDYPFWGIKHCKCMVVLMDFPYNSALFGLVSYNDPGLYSTLVAHDT